MLAITTAHEHASHLPWVTVSVRWRVEGATVEPTAEFAQLQRGFVDQTQWRYEVIRPLVLFADRTAQQRAQETHTYPATVRTLQRRFRQQGMRGLLPAASHKPCSRG
jgi:hypothetical protein